MKIARLFIVALLLALFAVLQAIKPPTPPRTNNSQISDGLDLIRNSGALLLKTILGQPWARDLKGVALGDVRLVEPNPSRFGVVSHKAWHARLVSPNGPIGYMLWDCETGQLAEFALDAKLAVDSGDTQVLQGVPPLQQFPLKDKDGTTIASGCVPTSAASVVGFWIARGQHQWKGNTGDLPEIAKRLRSRLRMISIPDEDGYTDNGMALAGAFPNHLAAAIQADANELNVPIVCRFQPFFSADLLKSEIAAGRPVLLSCGVRVPHKPELSWGHEVAGVAWSRVGDVTFVGVLDNFYPTQNADTIRWIAQDAFSTLITVKPKR